MVYPVQRPVPNRTPLEWVLLANAARARVFERDPGSGGLRELHDFVHPQARAKGTELDRDRPGHAIKGSGGAPSTAYQPPTEPHERERERFAREIAAHLEEAALAHRIPSLAVIASDPFLGDLRAQFGKATAALLAAQVPRDLTGWTGAELEHRVTDVLQAATTA